jgi:hypothetical protein
MKYFTKEWCFSDLNDREIDKRLVSYKDYISKIYEKLPFALKALSRNLNLHDGRLMKVIFNQKENALLLEGIFGDLQSGYYFLELKYIGISGLSTELLASCFRDQEIQVLSDEIEFISQNHFSHKFLFSTKRDIDIQFNDLQIGMRNAMPKDYKKTCCLFEIIHS